MTDDKREAVMLREITRALRYGTDGDPDVGLAPVNELMSDAADTIDALTDEWVAFYNAARDAIKDT